MTRTDVDCAIEALAGIQHGCFSRLQALQAGANDGVIRRRLTSTQWLPVERGVYRLRAIPETWEGRLMAAALAGGTGSAVARRSAAALWTVPGFGRQPVDVMRVRRRRHTPVGGYLKESLVLPDRHVTMLDAIPVTTPGRTLFDLAAVTHPLRVERALDNALAMKLVTLAGLHDLFGDLARRGRAGIALMRRLLDARGPGYIPAESELEMLFFETLEAAGLPLPERQLRVGDDEGAVGRIDYVYRSCRVIFELDGRRFHSQLLDQESDRRRDNRLMAAGWRVIRITWEQLISRPWEVVELVRRVLAAAA